MELLKKGRGLIALNAALLLALGVVTFAPASLAQKGGQPANGARARGEYTMVSGRIVGGSNHAIYIVDANNQEMLSMIWNQSNHGLDVIGYRDLRADAGAQPVR